MVRTLPAEHLSRRALLCGAACCLLPSRPAAAAFPARLAFEALRNGRKIGEQHMVFDTGDGLTVRTEVELSVKLGPIALYRYRHEATERWRADHFVSLDTRTLDNGRRLTVSARREGQTVMIAPSAGVAMKASPDTLPFTHWNRAIATAPLFNPQDGKLLRLTVAAAVKGAVLLADESSRLAEGVAFRGDADIEDWYGGDGVWTGLTGKLKDGSTLEYRRL